jgi:propionate CoA-transferase
MRSVDGSLEIIEIAPGVDIRSDVIAKMGFEPKVSPRLKKMDARLFSESPMEFGDEFRARGMPVETRSCEAA